MGIGARIKEARKLANLGQRELAEKLGVSSGAVGNWEAGISEPRGDTIQKLVEVLQVEPNFLFQDIMPDIALDQAEATKDDQTLAVQIYNALIAAGYVKRGEEISDAQYTALLGVVAMLDRMFSNNIDK